MSEHEKKETIRERAIRKRQEELEELMVHNSMFELFAEPYEQKSRRAITVFWKNGIRNVDQLQAFLKGHEKNLRGRLMSMDQMGDALIEFVMERLKERLSYADAD